MNKSQKKYKAINIYSVCIFIYTLLYNILIVRNVTPPETGVATYAFHAVDFSVGFCTKLLPGAIFNLLPGEISSTKIIIYESMLLILFFAALSVMLGKFIISSPEKYRKTAIILSFLFVTGPCTFSIYAYRIGMLDVYWVFLAALAVFFMQNKYLRWLMPLICVTAILVHISAMIAYIILFAMLLLYEYISAEDKKEKRIWGTIFLLSVFVSVAAFGYFIIFEKSNLTYENMEDFDNWLAARGGGGYYYDYALYGKYTFESTETFNFNEMLIPVKFSPAVELFVNKVLNQILFNFELIKYSNIPPCVMILLLAVIAPLLIPLYRLTAVKLKENNRNYPTVFFCICTFIQVPFTLVCALLTSVDVTRWTAHAFTVAFTLFLYMAYKEKETYLSYTDEYFSSFPTWQKALYCGIYMLTVFDPYC